MHQLNIDFIGPILDQGYILVIVATFTRWVELYYTTDASAAEWFLKHSSRFGAPHQLRSDNGPHFIAEIIREFLLLLVGVKHCLTLANLKEENAIVERYNKKINRHIRALTFENLSLTDYKKSLPFVQKILNSNHSDRLKIRQRFCDQIQVVIQTNCKIRHSSRKASIEHQFSYVRLLLTKNFQNLCLICVSHLNRKKILEGYACNIKTIYPIAHQTFILSLSGTSAYCG